MSALKRIVEAAANARKIVLDHFVYMASFPALVGGTTVSVTIPIQSDSDFLWMGTSLTVFTAANVLDAAPDLVFSVIDSGSGRQLQSAPMPVLGNTGTGQWPFTLPEPKLFVGNGSIQVTVTDRSAVNKAQVDFSFLGYKIFYTASYNRANMMAGLGAY